MYSHAPPDKTFDFRTNSPKIKFVAILIQKYDPIYFSNVKNMTPKILHPTLITHLTIREFIKLSTEFLNVQQIKRIIKYCMFKRFN